MKVKFLCNKKFFNRPLRYFATNSFSNHDEVTNLIKDSGFKGERHEVETRDGYRLTVHRIHPNERTECKGTVFLMHGLFRNSADYIATGPNVALPYYLAEHGYDCFLGNARGSKYCTRHKKYPYMSRDFWNFSWEEIGMYDLPAMIDLAIGKSGSPKVNYIGHSQGCTTVLALLASRPEYNEMISQLHLMAPAIFLDGSTSVAFNFLNRMVFNAISKKLYKFNIAPVLKISGKILEKSNDNPAIALKLYKHITCKYVGHNKGEVQLSLEAIKAFNYFMSPIVSISQLKHFLQLYQSGKFQRFDHEDNNQHHYGQSTPPEYNLANVIVPTYIYHAEQDALCVKTGMDRLASTLPNVKHYKILSDFNHIDVMLGKNSRELLYSDILKFLVQ